MKHIGHKLIVSIMILGLVLSACSPEVVEVEKEVVVTQIVKEEVEVEVEKVVEVEKPTEDAIGFVDIAAGDPIPSFYVAYHWWRSSIWNSS